MLEELEYMAQRQTHVQKILSHLQGNLRNWWGTLTVFDHFLSFTLFYLILLLSCVVCAVLCILMLCCVSSDLEHFPVLGSKLYFLGSKWALIADEWTCIPVTINSEWVPSLAEGNTGHWTFVKNMRLPSIWKFWGRPLENLRWSSIFKTEFMLSCICKIIWGPLPLKKLKNVLHFSKII